MESDASRLIQGSLFALREQSHASGISMPQHRHPEGQLYAVARGLIVVSTDRGKWMMSPGQIGWIPPNISHGACIHGAMSGWTGYLHPTLCGSLPMQPAVFKQTALSKAVFGKFLRSEVPAVHGDREQRLIGVLIDEIATLVPEPMYLPMPTTEKLAAIGQEIAATLSTKRSLDEIARRVGMSRRALTRQFRAETGLSIIEWRDAARTQRGMEMLIAGRTVTETAFALGYDGASKFITSFKRAFGSTPKQFVMSNRQSSF